MATKLLSKEEIINRSIIKKYRSEIWTKFTKAINEYELISDFDNIAVCISGGKDSFLLALCFRELLKHGKIKFNVKYIVMDPGYKDNHIKLIEENARLFDLDIIIEKTNIFEILDKVDHKSPCYMCAKMRRGYLYDIAKKHGCNKIALGHHYDDVIETILLSMFYNGHIKTMLPKLRSDNFEGMELIRPLYLVKESAIISWKKYNELEFIDCACKLKSDDSKRLEVKNLINELRQKSKYIEQNIFKSMENINLDQILGYYSSEIKYNYIDEYDK